MMKIVYHKKILLGLTLYMGVIFSALPKAATQDKEFVVMIASYQNKEWYEKNLDSVFSQKYDPKKYRVIYTDDASLDGTANLVEQYVKKHHLEDQFTLIRNKKNRGALANHYRAIHLCKDHEIILNVDGDDFLAHDSVMSDINKVYASGDIWITNGSHQDFPSGKRGYARTARQKDIDARYASGNWVFSMGQLRTFYAWLAKKVRLKDLIFHSKKYPHKSGSFYPSACDIILFYPMLDMAGMKHYQFIPEINYLYNVDTPLSDWKTKQHLHAEIVRLVKGTPRKPHYQELPHSLAGYFDTFENNKADIIILSQKNQDYDRTIARLESNIQNTGTLYLVTSDCIYQKTPNGLERQSASLAKALRASPNNHVIIATEDSLITQPIDASEAILSLEKTCAHSFLFSLDESKLQKNKIPVLDLDNHLRAWCLRYDTSRLYQKNSHHVTLYRKDYVLRVFKHARSNSIKDLAAALSQQKIPQEEVALCYEHAQATTQD